ncbi:phosphotransferase [Jiangella anatolica]|uniref:Bifunctional AAC/APH n=1 Tax=Jiangella anatolica TaxID=2670374 RepID=A0A2W2B533_9ACTN|nr:phosphotransferase [Jiangella anatolica]PZF80110.1 bifunctional AAC/APH [Jiangella anatolica]
MLDDVRAALRRHRPDLAGAEPAPLGAGLDNVAFAAGDLVLRRSRSDDGSARREAALLTAVAAVSSLPVPEPVFVDEATGILAYRRLPGAPLLFHPVPAPDALAGPLAEFLTGLHDGGSALSALVEVDDTPCAEWLADAAASYETAAAAVPAGDRRRIEAFLAAPPPGPPRRLTFCHADLGAEHVLVDGAAITGVIDWTDAAIADPAVDFARLYRDLGPDVAERIAARYGGDAAAADPERVAFYARCALLEDLEFGVTTGATTYLRAALAHLDHTFG